MKDNKNIPSMALTNNPVEPCGILSMSNIPTNTRGEFTNVRRDLYADRQGLWTNSVHNTPYATIDQACGTYSNLQVCFFFTLVFLKVYFAFCRLAQIYQTALWSCVDFLKDQL